MGDHQGFTVVLRGYDTGQVDAMMERVRAAAASTDPNLRSSVRQQLNGPGFDIRLRGYDRAQVDDYLLTAIDRLA